MPPNGNSRTYSAVLGPLSNGRARLPVPFDPNEAWGSKREHFVGGSINGCRVRGRVVSDDVGWNISIGASWLRDSRVGVGDLAEVTISPEGPLRQDLADDIADALTGNPAAAAFFDSLAQFYRKGYLRWIDATKRRPDVRAQRIVEVIDLLAAGVKERPMSR